ncbi:MAG TPA: tripartite tricarboxylate transporter permease [Deltaproteobacteria bacterium]|nr:tripartite tricarboxylate transporter permease [Deltaproteobacteria bacterium]
MGLGFSVALTPVNLLFCFIGVTLGTIIGALPGLGSVTGVAILLPLTFGMDPTTAIIMLAGIYYGVMYGGTISSILLNTPGDAAVVVSAIEGYPMARQGRAGAAFSMNALASFAGGTFGTIMLTAAAPAFAHAALRFGPPEYFSLMILGMASLIGLAGSNPIKGLIMTAFGFLLATVGVDAGRGVLRFTYDSVYMMTGINFLPVAIGMFGMGEVLYQMEDVVDLDILKTKIRLKTLLPTMADWVRSRMAIVRGSIIGFLVGVLPGAGATIASFLAYATEVKMTKHPEDIGKGAIEGLAAPEAANNAAAAGALVPMMTLGVPGSGTTAVLLGAFMMYGLQPGPLLFKDHPKLAWGLIASMYIGNVMLVILNTVFIPVFVCVLKMPQAILMPLILVLTVVGSYTLGNNMMDVGVMVIFGVIGYIAKKFNYPAAPLILGLVLGPITEVNFVRSASLAQGDLTIFFTRPLSLALLLGALLSLVFPLIKILFVRIRGLRR